MIQLIQFAEELVNKFSALNRWFENKGIKPYEALISFINEDGEVVETIEEGVLRIKSVECFVPLQIITKEDLLNLTGWELLEFSEVIRINVYLRDANGHFTYSNPFELDF